MPYLSMRRKNLTMTTSRSLTSKNIILTGEIIERQRDRTTREVKFVVRGISVEGIEAEAVVKLRPGGTLFVITADCV